MEGFLVDLLVHLDIEKLTIKSLLESIFVISVIEEVHVDNEKKR